MTNQARWNKRLNSISPFSHSKVVSSQLSLRIDMKRHDSGAITVTSHMASNTSSEVPTPDQALTVRAAGKLIARDCSRPIQT